MDITRPPLDRQVAPAPWLVFREHVDVPAAIRQMLADKPDATVDEITAALVGRGVQVSGMVVAMWLSRLRAGRGQADGAPEPPRTAASTE